MDEQQLQQYPSSPPEFHGDVTRNEVQLDLDKFVDLLRENNDLKEQIRELTTEQRYNPWQRWIHLAKTFDSWRVFPRLFITLYMVLLYYSTMWFMALNEPTMEQSGLISIIVGAGAAWFGLYTRTNGDGGNVSSGE